MIKRSGLILSLIPSGTSGRSHFGMRFPLVSDAGRSEALPASMREKAEPRWPPLMALWIILTALSCRKVVRPSVALHSPLRRWETESM